MYTYICIWTYKVLGFWLNKMYSISNKLKLNTNKFERLWIPFFYLVVFWVIIHLHRNFSKFHIIHTIQSHATYHSYSLLSKKIDKKSDILNYRKTSFTFVQKHALSSLITIPQKQIWSGGERHDRGSNRHKMLDKTISSMCLESPIQNLPLWFIYEISMMVMPLRLKSKRWVLYVTLTICYTRYRNIFKPKGTYYKDSGKCYRIQSAVRTGRSHGN